MTPTAEQIAEWRELASHLVSYPTEDESMDAAAAILSLLATVEEQGKEIEKLSDPAAVAVNMMVGKIAKPRLTAMLHVHGLYDDFARVVEIAARNESAPEIISILAELERKDA